MQLRKMSAFALYVGSYLPLSLVLMAQDIPAASLALTFCRPIDITNGSCVLPLMHPWWSLGMVGVTAVCLAITLTALNVVGTPRRIMVAEVKHIPADLINYVIPYIVSFIGLDYGEPTKLLGFAVLFLWIFWITYRSGQIAMNPVLIVFGWRLFELKYSYLQSEDERVGRALCQAEVHPNRIYQQGSLQDVMILRKRGQRETDG
ncbi:hypothetical protein NS277_11460 [Novosphingobium barchaimii]|nr:hypothetical protein NS277_11460 [Novosphingobium barchaimii]